jgi:protoheme IX farnesyltransferase
MAKNSFFDLIKRKLKLYLPLTKVLQTGLLLSTGLAGFMSARCPVLHWVTLLGVTVSLLLAISGSTVLNMWYDRDIDAKMGRTSKRPLPEGEVSPNEALRLGLILSILGVGLAVVMDPLYGLIVFSGIFFDVLIYTIWLKRRTCWSIVWGGISGGMPILAGRTLGVGHVDWVGILLALAILFWIPTHILTFSMRFHEDYRRAGVPTFPSTYGFYATRVIIAISSVLAALTIGGAALGVGLTIGYLRLIVVLSAGLFVMAVASVLSPSERVNFGLFKYASLYVLGTMILLAL